MSMNVQRSRRKVSVRVYKNEPISYVQWVPVDELCANNYNPNVVFDTEMKLLQHSIVMNGWLSPLIVNKTDPKWTIIDGFHRFWLAKYDTQLRDIYNCHVPCLVMQLSEAEAMLMTVRLNRSKGTHVAVKMHRLITRLIKTYGYTKEKVCRDIGANMDEIDLLLEPDVFSVKKIRQHKYSRAWRPRRKSSDNDKWRKKKSKTASL